jgi:hypothetical protein
MKLTACSPCCLQHMKTQSAKPCLSRECKCRELGVEVQPAMCSVAMLLEKLYVAGRQYSHTTLLQI